MSLLTKYHEASWKVTTFDKQEYYWNDAEYDIYRKASTQDIKILHFKDGSLALGDIRRVEKIVKPEPERVLPAPHEPDMPEEGRMRMLEKLEEIKSKFSIKKVEFRPLSQEEFEKRKSFLLEQSQIIGGNQ